MRTLRDLTDELDEPDLRTPYARAAREFMATKGYSDIRPIGTVDVTNGCYFYYVLPNDGDRDLLELEVVKAVDDELGREFLCTVSAYRSHVED